ncbi:MAG TPA: sigma-70 family RNA polymerase sigma factor [Thermoanaerobaculia bacterium]
MIEVTRELFESHLSLIRELTRSVGRRHRLAPEDVEDFSSHAVVRLMENDYAILRKFLGRSSFRTYLTVVVQRLFLDFQIQRWGKWRPPARVRRLGPIAVEMDKLINRDGRPLAQVLEMLGRRQQGAPSAEALLSIASQVPFRPRPRFETEESLEDFPIDGGVEQPLLDGERGAMLNRVRRALNDALGALTPEDRLMLKMRYEDGFSIREIASTLDLEARPLYNRFEKCLKRLRVALETGRVTRQDVDSIVGWAGADSAPLPAHFIPPSREAEGTRAWASGPPASAGEGGSRSRPGKPSRRAAPRPRRTASL